MTCRDAEVWIVRYAIGTAPAAAAEHITGCTSCKSLAEAIGRPNPVGSVPSAQLQQIKAKLRENLKPVKPLPPAGLFVAAFLLIVAVAVTIGAADLGTAGWQALSILKKIAVFAALTTACYLLAFCLTRQLTPGSAMPVGARLLLAAILVTVTAIFAILFDYHPEKTFVATGLVCFSIGLKCALPVAALSWLMLRRGMVLNPVAAGALAGTLAGLSGLTLLEIFCPNPNKYHILAWHLGAAIASAIAGSLIGVVIDRFGMRGRRSGLQNRAVI